MEQRLNWKTTDPEAYRTLLAAEGYLTKTGLERGLLNLMVLRASQINGCAYCVDMHSKDLRAEGESEQRIYLLPVWREAPFYTERERAALAWTEALTRLPNQEVPDDVYEQAHRIFTEKELVGLTMAVCAINSWNRINMAFRVEAGTYQPLATHRTRALGGSS